MTIPFSIPEKIESRTLWLALWVFFRSYVLDTEGNFELPTITEITDNHLDLAEYLTSSLEIELD